MDVLEGKEYGSGSRVMVWAPLGSGAFLIIEACGIYTIFATNFLCKVT